MKKAKSITALLLALVMTATIMVPAFAESEDEPQDEVILQSSDEIQEIVEEITETETEDGPLIVVDGVADHEFLTSETPKAESTTPEKPENFEQLKADSDKKGFSLWKSVFNDGVPTLKTNTFYKIFNIFKTIARVLTGKALVGADPSLEVTMDENLQSVCDTIYEQSGLDIGMILTNLPEMSSSAAIKSKIFNLDTQAYRDKMFAMRDEYSQAGDSAKAGICWALGVYMSGIKSAELWLEPQKSDPDVYRVVLDVTYNDGQKERMRPNIYINMATGECYGTDDKGMLSIGFNTNYYECFVYAPINCWMRRYGFCLEYDLLCYALPVYCYNTRRIYFDYNNKEYMVQMWKGNYLITNGGEVGVYYRDMGKLGTYYDVVKTEDQLNMSLQIWHGEDQLVNVPLQNHWWVNGFKMGKSLYSPHTLTLYASLEMKDEEMLEAFTKGIDRNPYGDIAYYTDGLTVYLVWNT